MRNPVIEVYLLAHIEQDEFIDCAGGVDIIVPENMELPVKKYTTAASPEYKDSNGSDQLLPIGLYDEKESIFGKK